MKIYAGFGSRKTPEPILGVMRMIAYGLAQRGYTLRSGHAGGADTAFETAAVYNDGLTEIYTPADVIPEWIEHAKVFHPAWHKLDAYGQLLMARNSPIILGASLNDPVEFGVCWTPEGRATGGSGQALRIADRHRIKIYNLYDDPEGINFFTKVMK